MGERIAIVAGSTAGNGRRAATHYGTREIEDVFGSAYPTDQGHEAIEFNFSFDDLPTFGLDAVVQDIPANAHIVSAELTAIEGITGTTPTVTIGLHQKDGTVIDADGIDVAIAAAALAVNLKVVCDGALVGKEIGDDAGQIVVTTGGTVTGGKFRLVVVFEPQRVRG